MDEEVKCPVCAWQWDGKRQTCPHCDFPIADFKDLLAGKRIVWVEKLKQQFDDLVAKHRKVYEARKAERLWEGDAFLGVATNEDAEISVDGKVVGKTKERYLSLSNLVSGKHLVEARTPYSYGRAEVELAPKDAKRVEITLEPLKGDLRVLSEVGEVEVEVEGKRYRPPVVIRGLSAGWKEVAVYQGKGKFLTDVEVLPGKVVDWTVTKEAVPEISLVWVGEHNGYSVWSVSFSPDGCFLASGSEDGTVRLWQVVADRKCVWVGEHKHNSLVRSVSFSPDGRFLASGSQDGTVRLWRVKDGQCVWVGEHKDWEHKDWVWSVSFSPDGRFLASGSEDGTVRLWRVKDGQCVWVRKHNYGVRSVCFSPDGRFLASGSEDGTVRLWRVKL
jgi:hypothetical protein